MSITSLPALRSAVAAHEDVDVQSQSGHAAMNPIDRESDVDIEFYHFFRNVADARSPRRNYGYVRAPRVALVVLRRLCEKDARDRRRSSLYLSRWTNSYSGAYFRSGGATATCLLTSRGARRRRLTLRTAP